MLEEDRVADVTQHTGLLEPLPTPLFSLPQSSTNVLDRTHGHFHQRCLYSYSNVSLSLG